MTAAPSGPGLVSNRDNSPDPGHFASGVIKNPVTDVHVTDVQEPEVQAVQALIKDKNFSQAQSKLTDLLSQHPDHPELLYMLAVCHRYLERYDQALDALERLRNVAPEHGRGFQEEGHTLAAMNRPEEAVSAYALACMMNPALEVSYKRRYEILTSLGRTAQAAQVAEQLSLLQKLPRPLIAVTDLIAQGKLLKAEEVCRSFLQKVPHHVEAMRLLADIGVRLGILDDAELLLESAAVFSPEHTRISIDYIQVLRRKQKFEAALAEADRLLARDPDNPQFQSINAVECMQVGDFDKALAGFERVLTRLPNDPVTLTSRGHALKTSGNFDKAVSSYQDAIIAHPSHGEAYYSLANLKTYAFSDDQVQAMRDQLTHQRLFYMDRVYLSFALGKAYEDRSDYTTAFKFYQQGNRLKKIQSRYDADKMSIELSAQKEICNRELFASFDGAGDPSSDPIFIVGLPRAGSTLIEQILASHSQVDGTHELPNVLTLSHQLRRTEAGYPGSLAKLSRDELSSFGQAFINDTRIHRDGAPFFIDKMPNNFRHIGLIRLMLPNAKIIDARRHPMACCFSGYKQLFAEGQEFTYDLGDLGQYYSDYIALMDHWDDVLPGFVLRVEHEQLVGDLEGEVRRILDFCGLAFEESCIAFHENKRLVRTPSSEQVRQPIFTTALEQWRHFSAHLAPLADALDPTVRNRYPFELS